MPCGGMTYLSGFWYLNVLKSYYIKSRSAIGQKMELCAPQPLEILYCLVSFIILLESTQNPKKDCLEQFGDLT